MSTPRCTKAGFDSEHRALARLEEIQDNPDPLRAYVPVGAYRCGCGRYHLTSKSDKPRGRGKQPRSPRSVKRKR